MISAGFEPTKDYLVVIHEDRWTEVHVSAMNESEALDQAFYLKANAGKREEYNHFRTGFRATANVEQENGNGSKKYAN